MTLWSEISGGTLAAAVPLHSSSLLFLVGGGRSPRYPPNKVILWDEAQGKEVADLEFRERVRGVACRRGWLAVALKRRVVVYKLDTSITRHAEYDTCENPKGVQPVLLFPFRIITLIVTEYCISDILGLLTLATEAYSTLLAIPGRQSGHVHIIHLPPCPPPTLLGPPPAGSTPSHRPSPSAQYPVSIIAAHESALTTLSVPPSGRLLATTSSRGTLVRVWDALSGKLIKEFRRGADKAEIYGVAFRPDEKELCVWSDKGTVHVFSLQGSGGPSNRQSSMSGLKPFLPKYFSSEWSYAQYRIPTQTAHITLHGGPAKSPTADITDEEKCVVGWIQGPVDEEDGPQEYQLVALTYTGGWYRLSVPGATTLPSSTSPRTSGQFTRPLSPTPSLAPSITKEFRRRSGSGSTYSTSRPDKGKEKEKDTKEGGQCVLKEYRRYGRWDGWG